MTIHQDIPFLISEAPSTDYDKIFLEPTQSMFDLVLEQARKAGAKKVEKINLVIGEITGVIGNCVQFYFDFISKGTLAEGVALSFAMVPPKA